MQTVRQSARVSHKVQHYSRDRVQRVRYRTQPLHLHSNYLTGPGGAFRIVPSAHRVSGPLSLPAGRRNIRPSNAMSARTASHIASALTNPSST